MKKIFACVALIGVCLYGFAASAASIASANSGTRGNTGLANAYRNNRLNTYYMVNQPDVDSACRTKIYNCLTSYCGDPTYVAGHMESRCQFASETELYNYALLCLQKDNDVLLPQYNNNYRTGGAGMNTAARLCPSYVQQELMSYLSMSNMATQLSKSHSDLCIQRRQELEAAMACHAVALAYGNETTSMLNSQLTDTCGAGVAGGSAEMVMRFTNAGNVGSNIWGWAEKIVNLDVNSKGAEWQTAVDAILVGYTNRMNLACGDNLQLNAAQHTSGDAGQPTTLQTAAALVTGMVFPATVQPQANPNKDWPVYKEVTSRYEIYDSDTATQVVMAGLGLNVLTQNAFLTSAQMDDMQTAYKRGTKVFIIRDSTRCFIVPVRMPTDSESSVIAQMFPNCIK